MPARWVFPRLKPGPVSEGSRDVASRSLAIDYSSRKARQSQIAQIEDSALTKLQVKPGRVEMQKGSCEAGEQSAGLGPLLGAGSKKGNPCLNQSDPNLEFSRGDFDS